MAALVYPLELGRPIPPLRLLAPSGGSRPTKARSRPAARRFAETLLLVGALVGTWCGAGALAGSGHRPSPALPDLVRSAGGYTYVVQPGDTLWSIATRFEPGADPRPLVDALADETGGASLLPGTVVHLP